MAANITITCPKCKNHLRGPAEVQGKKVKCKGCGTTFTVPPAPAAPARTAPDKKPAGPVKAKPAAAKAPAKPKPGRAKPGTAPEGSDANPYVFLDDDAALSAINKAQSPSTLPAPGSAEARNFDRDDNPYGVTTLDLTPRCPHCAGEMEDEEAIVCLHCGYNTRTRTHAVTKRIYHNTAADRVRWLLPGVVCFVTVLGLIGFDVWFVFGLQSTWDAWDKNMDSTSFSLAARVFMVVGTGFGMWYAGRFAFIRLILHPTPPEVEKQQ